ncbi:hypothetical protein MZM54_03975 [[Brevibacterium] frigoritolerans]|nr:hypothetical protein [Peribacillus frigoritolerans]
MFEIIENLIVDVFTIYLLVMAICYYILNAIVGQLIKVVSRTTAIVYGDVKLLLSLRYIKKHKENKAYLR